MAGKSKQFKPRTYVAVSRRWQEIKVENKVIYSVDGIEIELELDEFLQAMAKEMGHPIKLLTSSRQLGALRRAAANVCEEMKRSTAVSPPPVSVDPET